MCLLARAAAIVCVCTGILALAWTEKPENAKISALFGSIADANSPGFAIMVRQRGNIVFKQGYGVRDLQTMRPINAGTNFRLASFTKQFTAMATMLLVHEGRLRYNQTLTEVFPEFPAYGRNITIRNLLTHTSGLPDYEDLMDQAEKAHVATWSATHQIHDNEVLKLLEHQTHGKFAPGSSWAYSNSAYVVLGLIDARAARESFPRVLQDRIFGPLHMTRTLAFVNGLNEVPERAYGYSKEGDKFVETDQSSTSATLGDGGVYSNLNDLEKWDAALSSHALLSRQDINAALTPVKLSDGTQPHWPVEPGDDNLYPGQPVSYGFGWFLDSYRNQPRMWHTGTTVGFRTAIERFTGKNLTVIVLCNRADLDANALALKAADAAMNQ